MQRTTYYRADFSKSRRSRKKKYILIVLALLIAFTAYKIFAPSPVERAINQLQFDDSIAESEKETIRQAIETQSKTYDGSVSVHAETAFEQAQTASILSVYVPVTNVYSARQAVTKAELAGMDIFVPTSMDDKARAGLAALLGVDVSKLVNLTGPIEEVEDTAVAFVPAGELSFKVKLLTLEGNYYLDTFRKGAAFRSAAYSGEGAASLADLKLNNLPNKEATLKVNMTGVTALTRLMMRKLNTVKDPLYFSQHIGDFLADADITHVSNEVSFKDGCGYSDTLFCSPPAMIEVLKASGVDIVELTGNHNNDVGAQYNTESINLYHSLGWKTIGGGLNTAEAAKFYVADQKGSKVAFLAYNYPDSPNGGAIAGSNKAGANSFDYDKIKSDVESAKQQANFVIVDIQFWECYAYPDGYVEFPECDGPIPTQAETFQKVADLGADMVIGTSAHQPQTYEIYSGKPIYYGLGNLYFDQDRWPGTERGIILTHYFQNGKLIQTKLSPTVYHTEYQTRLMDNADAVELLDRLNAAR